MTTLTQIINLVEAHLARTQRMLLHAALLAGFVPSRRAAMDDCVLYAPQEPLVILTNDAYRKATATLTNLTKQSVEFMAQLTAVKAGFLKRLEQTHPALVKALQDEVERELQANGEIYPEAEYERRQHEAEVRVLLRAMQTESANKALISRLYHLSVLFNLCQSLAAKLDAFNIEADAWFEAVEEQQEDVALRGNMILVALNDFLHEQYRLSRDHLLPLQLDFLQSPSLASVPPFLVRSTESGLRLMATPIKVSFAESYVRIACRHQPERESGAMAIIQPYNRPDYTVVLRFNAKRQVIKAELAFTVEGLDRLPQVLQGDFREYAENTLDGLLLKFEQTSSRREKNAIKVKIQVLYQQAMTDLSTLDTLEAKEECAATLLTARAFIAQHTPFWRKEPSLAELLVLIDRHVPTLRQSFTLPDTLLGQVLDHELKITAKVVDFLDKNIKKNKKFKVQAFEQLIESRVSDCFANDLNRRLTARAQLNALLMDQRVILINEKSLTLAQASVQQIVRMTAVNSPAMQFFKNLPASVNKALAVHCQKVFYLTHKTLSEDLSASVSAVFEFLLTDQLPPLTVLKDPAFYQAFMCVADAYPASQVALTEKLCSIYLRELAKQDKGDDFTDDGKALLAMLWQEDQGLFFGCVLQRAAEQPHMAILNYLQSEAFRQERLSPSVEAGYQRFVDFLGYYARNKDHGPAPMIHAPLAEAVLAKIHESFLKAMGKAQYAVQQPVVSDIFASLESVEQFLNAPGASTSEKIKQLFRDCGNNSEQKERLCIRLLSYFKAGLENKDTFHVVFELVNPELLHLIVAKTAKVTVDNRQVMRSMIVSAINSVFSSGDSLRRFFGGPGAAPSRVKSLRALCDQDKDLLKCFKNDCGSVRQKEDNVFLLKLLKASFSKNKSRPAGVGSSNSDYKSELSAQKITRIDEVSSVLESEQLAGNARPPVVHAGTMTAVGPVVCVSSSQCSLVEPQRVFSPA